jgi:amino acid transporter
MSFEDIYGITYGAANLLMVPMVFSTALAFLDAAGCQMQSMSKSGLLPAYLSKTHGANHVPVYGILTAALLGYIARVLRWHLHLTDTHCTLCLWLVLVVSIFPYFGATWSSKSDMEQWIVDSQIPLVFGVRSMESAISLLFCCQFSLCK